jgi:hypothetical protein
MPFRIVAAAARHAIAHCEGGCRLHGFVGGLSSPLLDSEIMRLRRVTLTSPGGAADPPFVIAVDLHKVSASFEHESTLVRQ